LGPKRRIHTLTIPTNRFERLHLIPLPHRQSRAKCTALEHVWHILRASAHNFPTAWSIMW
jgi:hypothetical protein